MSEIVPVREAAEAIYVTRPLVDLWRKKGWIKTYRIKHPVTGRECNGVDLDEVRGMSGTTLKSREEAKFPPEYVSYQEASEMLYVSTGMISHYVKRGYLTPYYLYTDKHLYALKVSELEQVRDKIKQARIAESERMKKIAHTLVKDERGKYTGERKAN